jgi:hypothetical protein
MTCMYPGKWSQQFRDKPALVIAETGETLTDGQLDERSIRLSRHLHDATGKLVKGRLRDSLLSSSS